MIRSLGAVILAAILTLEAGGAAHADWWDDAKEWLNPTQEVVAIDAWWTIDYGKNSCA
jgi:hypothetical protein